MYQYRQTLYRQYFDTQAGRRLQTQGNDVAAILAHDKWLLYQELLPLLPPIAQQPHIIDLGCGFGSWVYALQQKGYVNVSGIDLSPNQVAVAHSLGIANISQADILPYLQANPNTFDVICGIDIIEHFGKDELVEALTHVMQALRPGGKAVFRTPNADAPFASVYANGDFTHETILNASSAQQLFYSIGFSEVQVQASCMNTPNAFKNILRKISWQFVKAALKAVLFATGRSGRGVLLSPNLIIAAQKA